jgi:phospholipid transport system substrate-binding protein
MINLLRVCILFVSLGYSSAGSYANESQPTKAIVEFHESLLQVMKKAKLLNAKERYEKLEPALDRAFDFGIMIRLASGSAWNRTDKLGKDNLTQAFRRMSIATYAYRFKGYSGQRFETIRTDPGSRGTQIVLTQLISPQENKRDKSIKLAYVTKKIGSMWKIIDILLNGSISEISVRYSEYRATLKGTRGASNLAIILNKKADALISN